MGDIITFLQFLQKLEQGRLIPTEQIEQLADILESTLRKNLCNGVYDSLEDLLEGQLNSNEQNPLFIDILKETTQKQKEESLFNDTLTKLIEYLDDQSKNTSEFKYSLDFKVPSRDKEYIEIYKDPDQCYMLKYANISDTSGYTFFKPLKDLNLEDISLIWDTIQETQY